MSTSGRATPTWAKPRPGSANASWPPSCAPSTSASRARSTPSLICGDLFDSNAQPRRSVERAVGELRRLTDAGIRVVIIPGTHDVYDSHSIYRAFDLARMAGLPPDSDLLTVLTPERPELVIKDLDLVVYGRVFATKRAPRSPLEGFSARRRPGQLEGRHDPWLASHPRQGRA